jgi:hypothetical protein
MLYMQLYDDVWSRLLVVSCNLQHPTPVLYMIIWATWNGASRRLNPHTRDGIKLRLQYSRYDRLESLKVKPRMCEYEAAERKYLNSDLAINRVFLYTSVFLI